MNILMLHPNFPGQYVLFAPYVGAKENHTVVALSQEESLFKSTQFVKAFKYKRTRVPSPKTHMYNRILEEAVIDGQAVYRSVKELGYRGFVPDIIIGHTGWGSTLFLKDLYPAVPIVGLFEWFYRIGADLGYFSGEKVTIEQQMSIRMRNSHHLINLDLCDAGYCATEWQRSQFPAEYLPKLAAIHDGIDTQFCSPAAETKLVLDDVKLDLSDCREIITYVSRGFEAYRGFPQFMDALRLVLARRPHAHVVLVGSDRVCYGDNPANGKNYRQMELDKGGFDTKRVHFVGVRNRADYQKILRASNLHVYLTRPFVLSWSMLEAMSFGCPLVASATPPVEEVVIHGENGLLADFLSPSDIADKMETMLADRDLAARLGKAARQTVVERYDVNKMLPKLYDYMMAQL